MFARLAVVTDFRGYCCVGYVILEARIMSLFDDDNKSLQKLLFASSILLAVLNYMPCS